MSLGYNKALVRRWHDLESWKEVEAIAEILAPDYLGHRLDHPEPATREDVIRSMNAQRCAFPDLHDTIHEIVVEGDLVAVRFTRTATFEGRWRELEPTRRTDSVPMFQLVRIAGDQIAESWLVWDSARLEKLLGIYGKGFCKEVYP
jgi:predicted ester cyclase